MSAVLVIALASSGFVFGLVAGVFAAWSLSPFRAPAHSPRQSDLDRRAATRQRIVRKHGPVVKFDKEFRAARHELLRQYVQESRNGRV